MGLHVEGTDLGGERGGDKGRSLAMHSLPIEMPMERDVYTVVVYAFFYLRSLLYFENLYLSRYCHLCSVLRRVRGYVPPRKLPPNGQVVDSEYHIFISLAAPAARCHFTVAC